MRYKKLLFIFTILSVLLSGCTAVRNGQKLIVEERVLYSNIEEIYTVLSDEPGLIPGDIKNEYNRVNYCDFDIESNSTELTGRLYYTYTQEDLPENHSGGAYPGRSVRFVLNERTLEKLPQEVMKKCTKLLCNLYGIQNTDLVIHDIVEFTDELASQNILYAHKEYGDVFVFLYQNIKNEKVEITIARKDFGDYYLKRLGQISDTGECEIIPELFPVDTGEVKEIVDENDFGWKCGGYGFSDLKNSNLADVSNTVENLCLVDGTVHGKLHHRIRFIYGEAGHCVSVGNAFDNMDEINQNAYSDITYSYTSGEVRELFEDGCALYSSCIYRDVVTDEFIDDIREQKFKLYDDYGLWEKEMSGVWYYVPLKEENGEITISNIHIMDDDFHSRITAQYSDKVWPGICYESEN